MPCPVELYEEMSLLSARMADAARAGDWAALIELERAVHSLRKLLPTAPEERKLPKADSRRRRVLIQRILDDDAEIRRHTEPWMEHVRHLLGDNQRLRELQHAYGTGVSTAGR